MGNVTRETASLQDITKPADWLELLVRMKAQGCSHRTVWICSQCLQLMLWVGWPSSHSELLAVFEVSGRWEQFWLIRHSINQDGAPREALDSLTNKDRLCWYKPLFFLPCPFPCLEQRCDNAWMCDDYLVTMRQQASALRVTEKRDIDAIELPQ